MFALESIDSFQSTARKLTLNITVNVMTSQIYGLYFEMQNINEIFLTGDAGAYKT